MLMLLRKNRDEYLDKLMNKEDVIEADIVAVGDDVRIPVLGVSNVAYFLKDEVQEAVMVVKSGKAPDIDGVADECVESNGATEFITESSAGYLVQ